MKFLIPLSILMVLFLPRPARADFFSTDADQTFQAARKENKPVLIDFFGIWCPPCNELDETVFETPSFVDKAKRFKLLKVDADAPASFKLKDKYKIGGYPTILFTNPRGEEIYRIVGYRDLKEFTRIMDLVLNAKGKNFEAACKSATADDLWRCATICSERKDAACAARAFGKLEKKLKAPSPRYQLARASSVDGETSPDAKRDGYARLMTEMPSSPLALTWAVNYLEAAEDSHVPPKTDLVEKVLALYPRMATDLNMDELGVTGTDLAEARADLLGRIGKAEEAKTAWKDAARLLAQAAATLPAGVEARGFTLERIECLEQAGEVDAALELANDYRARFPKEFTFHYLAAMLLYRSKKYTEGLPLAQKAFELSYGDNRIRAATLLVSLYATVPNKEAARKVYDDVTREMKVDSSLDVRTHRYLKQLADTIKKLPA